MGGPPTGASAPRAGAAPPWAAKKSGSTKKEDGPASDVHTGGFVARMKSEQEKAEKLKNSEEAEKAVFARRNSVNPPTGLNMFSMMGLKRKVDKIAKKQTIKRTSDYEKGHEWMCACCGKSNKASLTGCQICGRPARYYNERSRPAHGVDSAKSIRSLQGNYMFEHDVEKVNEMDDGRWTPLHNACVAANPGLVETLLNAGAVVEARTGLGFRPLHFAATSKNMDCVDACLHHGASVVFCKTFSSLLSPLHMAAQVGHPGILTQLIEAGTKERLNGKICSAADVVNIVDSGGRSPLHHAAASGHIQACVVLLLNGGELDKQDTDGWTSKHMAEFFGHEDLVEYFYRKEHPGLAMSGVIKLPPQKWHSEIYSKVKEDIIKEKKHLEDVQKANAEIAEMVRLSKGGRSFLESGFHAEQTRELSIEEAKEKDASMHEARIKMQMAD